MIALLGKQNFAYWVIFKSMFPIQNRKAILRMLHPNQTKWGKKEEIWWREPGCFGTGQLAALAGSEVQPYPPGTAFCLFTFFHLFFGSDFSPFTPRHSLFPPLASLSTHYPSTVPTALQGRGAWQAWSRKATHPAFSLVGTGGIRALIGRRVPLVVPGERGLTANVDKRVSPKMFTLNHCIFNWFHLVPFSQASYISVFFHERNLTLGERRPSVENCQFLSNNEVWRFESAFRDWLKMVVQRAAW